MTGRRQFIKETSLLGAVLAAAPIKSFAISHQHLRPDDETIGHNGFRYKVDKAWGKISPDSNPLLNCHEMVQDSQGRLIMVGDNTRNNILIFDKSGKLLDNWGHAYPGGHGLTLAQDDSGEDFLLIADCGWYQDKTGKFNKQQGQIVKTSVDGRFHFAIGHPLTIGIYKADEPFMPTETAVAPNGDIYVADGYGSDYIIQYNSKGQYIRHFGGHNNADNEHNLSNAHGVAVDLRDKANPRLICTSRAENCFKIFTMDGKYLERVDLPGMHICRAVIKGDNLYAGVCWSKDADGKTDWGDSGFVTILDKNNRVVSSPGGMAPMYENGILRPTLQAANPTFHHGHDVCVDEDENLYVCQWKANYTPPVKLTRV
ncbi:6-bladed beta-propeller [Persicitalea jodogahamensis]|uniref:Peptidylglycine monooxygenase n=1 Tax=Persicitalea jodogahamensis TaxID=402147 RepID=A0A8J3D809_9BACT|nr:6-bladed beta-propeller [Persicitalea jodogahamensis]GHB63544.1 peptidylglycine monooxygenase [Persicitalea jodogahamensis]